MEPRSINLVVVRYKRRYSNRMWNKLFGFNAKSPFTPLENSLLLELQRNLKPDTRELLSHQIEAINFVQRHTNSCEVNCYSMRSGKPCHDSAYQFPNRGLDVKFAVIRFSTSSGAKSWTANFHAVDGYLFSIIFTPSPEDIQKHDDIQIISVKILHDTMSANNSSRSLTERDKAQLTGWLGTWSQKYQIKNVYQPMQDAERQNLLQDLLQDYEVSFPQDYLELLKQCEGLMVNNVSILGLSQSYEVVLPHWKYLTLAEIANEGILGLREQSDLGCIYFLGYEASNAVEVSKSFREAVEKMLMPS